MKTARWFGAVTGMLLGMWVMAFAQSWTSPKTWSAGELVTPGHLNTHVRDNLTVLRAGGIAIASQAANDIIIATSATQLGRTTTLPTAVQDNITRLGTLSGTNTLITPEVYRNVGNSYLRLSGGNGAGAGAVIAAYGQSHAQADQISFVATGGINTTGYINSASAQPGFLAYNSADLTTHAAGSTIVLNTEDHDTASNYAVGTGIFTAPVPGKYHFSGVVSVWSSTGNDGFELRLVTTGRSYKLDGSTTSGTINASTSTTFSGSAFVHLDAGQTAYLITSQHTNTVTILSGAVLPTHFSGRLMP